MRGTCTSSGDAAAISPKSSGTTGSACRFTRSGWTAGSSSGPRECGRGFDLGGADGLYARGIDWRNPQHTFRPKSAGERRKKSRTTGFGAPQIAGNMIVTSLHGRRSQSPSRRKRRAESAARRRARQGVGRHGADRRAESSRSPNCSGRSLSKSRSARRGCSISCRWNSKSWRRAPPKTNSPRSRPLRRRRRSPASTQASGAQHLPRRSAARARGDRGAEGLRLLRRRPACASSARM